MRDGGVSIRSYFVIFGALIALTGLTVAVALVDLGHLNTAAALVIAGTKALLVLVFFMHLKISGSLVRLFAASGVFWLLVAFVLALADYTTRF